MINTPKSSAMQQMLQFYGLREHPFGVSPDPRFLYPSTQHREAMASLIYGIENQVGIAALIAEPGAGKTTLLFDILHRFQNSASTAFVFNTQCTGQELLRQVVLELQISGAENESDPIRLHQLFTSFVASKMNTKPVLIIIDEAQNLEKSALETLRLLSNFEAANQKLLHIVLAGQPQLADKLRHPSLTQLLQRITIVSRLERLSHEQMTECIAFRLRVAGFEGERLFTDEAMAKIITASGGLPRELNRICVNAMQLGFAMRQLPITIEAVEEVLGDLTLAKWMPEAELPLSGMPMAEVPESTGPFRVGASVVSRSEAPRESAATGNAAPIEINASAAPATQVPEENRARRQDVLYRERQRAVLRAAAQRRYTAELRLRGVRKLEKCANPVFAGDDDASGQSSAAPAAGDSTSTGT